MIKHSPLCNRDLGREIYFTAQTDHGKFRITVPAALLDAECGDTATVAKRKAWVKDSMDRLLTLLSSPAPEGPLSRVQVEEIS